MLQPYAEQRLQALHQAEQKFEEAFKAAQKRVVSSLETGKAPDFAFTLYHQADKTKQEEMVRTYVFGRLKDDPELQRQREVLARESVVVPVAIDLGIAQLARAQHLKEPKARKAELERAEKTFLAVRGQAGKTTEYRFSLGQVYYWLGRQAEGRKLFDEILADGRRNSTC